MFFKTQPTPTALDLAVATKEAAERDLLEHSTKQEYHTAMAKMLKRRTKRLEADITRLRRAASPKAEAPATIAP